MHKYEYNEISHTGLPVDKLAFLLREDVITALRFLVGNGKLFVPEEKSRTECPQKVFSTAWGLVACGEGWICVRKLFGTF